MPASAEAPVFDLGEAFKGRRILFVGSTGFVGKVALSMFLARYPEIDKMFVLVRPGAGSSSDERFFKKVVSSPVFDPIRAKWGAGTDAFLREKCVALAGDVSRPMLNFSEEDLQRIGKLDAIINCAGVVTFDPTLETAIRINVLGPKYTLDVAKRTGAAVVHVSTCFVVGERDGEIFEDDEIRGYFPRKEELGDAEFSVETELADCQKLIEQTKARADDRQHVSEFRERGRERLKQEGRDPDDDKAVKVSVQRERKMWISQKLTELGMERARHWGWTNTYTYTKSLGEQLCVSDPEVRACIVRPAIVESAMSYPSVGWNEGFTTTAPLAFLAIKGHRTFPAGHRSTLDIIPVDYVAAGLIMATAATIAGENKTVYQLGSSDVNPLWVRRTVELVGLSKRRYFQERDARGEGSSLVNQIVKRLEPIPSDRDTFNRISAPLWKRAAKGLTKIIDDATPKWGAPRVQAFAERAKDRLEYIGLVSEKTNDLFQLFMPFIYERKYIFRCDNTRALYARLSPRDRQLIAWAPEQIDWLDYWMNVHMRGLEKWIFPSLEEEFEKKARSVYTYRDLLEMFDTATKQHKSRTAMRLLPPPGSTDEIARYTYADLQAMAQRIGAALISRGVTVGDKVLLVSENRPEWGITYFGILKAGASVVPVDWQSTPEEIENLVTWSRARAVILSDKVSERLDKHPKAQTLLGDAMRIRFDDILVDDISPTTALVKNMKGDDLASLIFTSGTTGRPKGVMLTHRNFTSLISKLAGVFDIDKHDGLLSVLPLHHTFEFTAGLLMPLMRGAQISYLDDVNADSLSDALESGTTTGMVGVPALWQALHRKVTKQVGERGPLVERAFEGGVDLLRKLRENAPVDLALGRLALYPIHRRFGGRLRLMISGGSALEPQTMNAFRGMGFNLYEGYGLTEASPVLTVTRPTSKIKAGSVGEALPGVDVKIDNPDASGVGEVIASGPNVMAGYFENQEATDAVIRNGWLHTGDLGRIDDKGRLYIVGRKKEMILGSNGENVYPDELEEVYRDSAFIKELSIVGLPTDGSGETVATMIVPDYEANAAKELTRDEVRERISEHVKNTSAKLPLHKRVKILHLTDRELPKTSTRKVKRRLVVEEIEKLEKVKKRAEESRAESATSTSYLLDVLATVANRPRAEVTPSARLADLGYDSLMYTELGVALEAAGVAVPDNADLTGIDTVADFEKIVSQWGTSAGKKKLKSKPRPSEVSGEAEEIRVPRPVVVLGNAALDWAQRMTYEKLFTTRVTGRAYIPKNNSFIVAANHASHLDMGLVKHALGDWGPQLVALAAKDYFFEDPVKRAYFENFTNLVPMERHGSLRESLRLAAEIVKQGRILLIFPEGTRSTSGVMVDFKPSLGYLALQHKTDVLPMYLEGTYDALPKGSVLPKERAIAAHVGPVLTYEALAKATEGMSKSDAFREASRIVERAVRSLAPRGSVDRGEVAPPSTKRLTAESVMTDAAEEM